MAVLKYRTMRGIARFKASKLRCEKFEDRRMLTAIVVTSAADNTTSDGLVTLREAIQAANTDASVDGSAKGNGTDTIAFAPSLAGQTILLNGSQLQLTSDISLMGLGADHLTISGNHLSRIMDIIAGVNVHIDGLTFMDGVTSASGGAIQNNSNLRLSNCTLTGNAATSSGGAIVGVNGQLQLTSCLVSGNSAGNGGGINGGNFTVIDHSTISGNTANNAGGGICSEFGTLEVFSSTISGNHAGNADGGIAADGGAAVVMQSTIDHNSAGNADGGLGAGEGATLTVIDSTITNNSCGNAVAGVGVEDSRSSVLLINTTITNNVGGAGLDWGNGSATIRNSIIVGNDRSRIDIQGYTVAAASYNLFGVASNAHFSDDIHNTYNADPGNIFETGVLANNGGPTQTIALKRTGIAIDAGSNANAISPFFQPLTVDQRSFPRINGAAVDVGAVEFQQSPVITADAAQVGDSSARLSGGVFAEADTPVEAFGILYSLAAKDANPQLGDANVTNVPASGMPGAFAVNIANLSGGQQYSQVVYATIAGNTQYSNVVNFTPNLNVAGLPGVHVQVIANQLIVDGDNLADHVQIQGTGNTREYVVTGLDGTTVNGIVNGAVTVMAVDSIKINMTAGADRYTLDKANLMGDLVIGEGSGGKSIKFGLASAVVVGGNVSINGGIGNDTIYVNQTYVTGSMTIVGGSAGSSNQITTAFSSIGKDLIITGSSGYDLVQQTQVSIGGAWTINVGGGNDLISAAQCASIGNATFTSGTGIDTIAIAGVNLHSAATFDGSAGGGTKTLNLYSSILGDMAYMIGGGSNDIISFDNNVAKGVVIGGSSGGDTVAVRTSIIDQLFANLEVGNDDLTIKYTHVRQSASVNGGGGSDVLHNIGNLFEAGLQQKNFETISAS